MLDSCTEGASLLPEEPVWVSSGIIASLVVRHCGPPSPAPLVTQRSFGSPTALLRRADRRVSPRCSTTTPILPSNFMQTNASMCDRIVVRTRSRMIAFRRTRSHIVAHDCTSSQMKEGAGRDGGRGYAALLQGSSRWTPARTKSAVLRVTTPSPCTRAVAAISASGWA